MICGPCRAKLHNSCLAISCECNQASHQLESAPSPTNEVETEDEGTEVGIRQSLSKGGGHARGNRSQKRDAALKDQQSTGRKRAARQYPLNRDGICEWQGLSNVGGGNHPIVGCITGLQEARHHGPDKSTSNNDEGNVHRICHRCHNRWHAANNKDYDWTSTLVNKHDPREQTKNERDIALLDELVFKGSKQKRIKD